MLWKTDTSKLSDEIGACKTALKGLSDRLDSVERQPKLLQMEWESTLDKMNRVMGRLNARIRKADELGIDDKPPDRPQEEVPPETLPGAHRTLRMARARHGLLPR